MEYGVSRVLEQYDALIEYFKKHARQIPVNLYVILTALEDLITKIYLQFLQYALKMFNEFNTLFQTETPLPHTLKHEVQSLIRNYA